MAIQYQVEWQAKTPFRTIGGIDYCIWRYRIKANGAAAEMPAQVGLAFSRNIDIRDPLAYPEAAAIQNTSLNKEAGPATQYVLTPIQPADDLQVDLSFLAPGAEDAFAPLQLVAPAETPGEWQSLPFRLGPNDPEALTQVTLGPAAVIAQSSSTPPDGVLNNAARRLEKATLVPLQVERPFDGQGRGMAIAKNALVRQLALQPGEVEAVRQQLGRSGRTAFTESQWEALAAFEQPSLPVLLPSPGVFTEVPISSLQAFSNTLVRVRQQALAHEQTNLTPATPGLPAQVTGSANLAVTSPYEGELMQAVHVATTVKKNIDLIASGRTKPIGMLNLERLEMSPAGIQRGELVATIPLAPLEETAVVHKEWSVTSKEFTSIVSDSLESVSETGVTDNTELAQSTSSQIQHANQFNITGTVSGGIPLISGSTTTAFGAQDASSQSATDSRKHAVSITQKAASRSKQEHKITISTKTETGTSETTTRLIKNSSPTDPVRIDYFSLMRKWNIRLYRYGLRLTYDVVIPEPAAAMREAYARLDQLRSKLGPFDFPVQPSEITRDKYPNEDKEHYLVLADRYHTQVPHYPEDGPPLSPNAHFNVPDTWSFGELAFEVPAGYVIKDVFVSANIGDRPGPRLVFSVLGSKFYIDNRPGAVLVSSEKVLNSDGTGFLAGATGRQTVTVFFHHVDQAWVGLRITLSPSAQRLEEWRNGVWNALYNAAQTRYYSEQQEIQAQIAQLESQLDSVDTLTLRREESDEVMKGVLRFLLGPGFEFMPDAVLAAIEKTGSDPKNNTPYNAKYGLGFATNKLGMTEVDFALVNQYEEVVRFINQAIEWENVATFLYSYFWDMPPSWAFIRQIRHPDATRQAFLRAGSARVVLTIRKGWEERWVRFQDTFNPNGSTSSPYLSIAQEIAAYDDRNYPGIPPANPGRSAVRLEDAIYTTSTGPLNPAAGPVTIEVESSAGILPGLPVVIDSYTYPNPIQESQLVTAVPGPTQIVVERLDHAHGQAGPFPIVQPGEKGVLIAEWNEYTPTSGTDIAVTSNLATIS